MSRRSFEADVHIVEQLRLLLLSSSAASASALRLFHAFASCAAVARRERQGRTHRLTPATAPAKNPNCGQWRASKMADLGFVRLTARMTQSSARGGRALSQSNWPTARSRRQSTPRKTAEVKRASTRRVLPSLFVWV